MVACLKSVGRYALGLRTKLPFSIVDILIKIACYILQIQQANVLLFAVNEPYFV